MIEMLRVAADLGTAGMVIAVLWMMLRHSQQQRIDTAQQRESFLETIRNHLDHSTKAGIENAQAVRDLKGSVDALKEVLTAFLATLGK